MYRSFREEAVFVQNLQYTLAKSSKIIYTGSANRHKAHSEGIEICHVKERRFIWCFVYIKNNDALGFFFSSHKCTFQHNKPAPFVFGFMTICTIPMAQISKFIFRS